MKIINKGAYKIDFDKFDDPNFNPFETKSNVENKEATLSQPETQPESKPDSQPASQPKPDVPQQSQASPMLKKHKV